MVDRIPELGQSDTSSIDMACVIRNEGTDALYKKYAGETVSTS